MPTVTQLNVEIGAKLDKLDKGLGQANRKLDGFGNDVSGVNKKMSGFNKTIRTVGASLVGAFAGVEITRAIGGFIADAGRMAAEAQGVENAFNKLNKPGILSELQISTRGTVNNLELMRRAVQANNFKIPLERLGTFFKFATDRAIETGESVDFLVNSIVTGIGRKSPLILDNLGISAAELSAEVKKVGDFGQAAANIIEREMAKAGEVMDTAAIASQQLSTSIENLKLTFGNFVTSPGAIGFTKFLAESIEGLNSAFGIIFSVGEQGATPLSQRIEKIRNDIQKLDRLIESDREFGVLSNIGISSQRTEEETNALVAKRQALIKELVGLVQFENKEQKKKVDLLNQAGTATDNLKTKANEAAIAQQQQFEQLRSILGEMSQTIESPNLGFDQLETNLIETFKQLPEGITASTEKATEFDSSIQNLSNASLDFTNVLTSGLSQILSLLFQNNSEASKFGRVISGIAISLLGTAIGGPAGGLFSSIFRSIGSFASGGIAVGPQLAVVGDNPGRREAIIPSELFGELGGPQVVVLGVEISADKLRIAEERNSNNRNRNFASR